MVKSKTKPAERILRDTPLEASSGASGDVLTSQIDLLDKGPEKSKTKSAPERRCILSHESKPISELIRFVLSPDGQVVPDVNCKLPGRGAWVTARQDLVEEAAKKNAFARAFKTKLAAPKDLGMMTADVLERFTIGSLSMARASGALITGFAKIDSAIRSGEAWLVLEAKDGAADGKRKIAQACRAVQHMGGEAPQVFELFVSEQMANAISSAEAGGTVVHMAFMRNAASRSAVSKIRRLARYKQIEAVDLTPQTGSKPPQD